jgi:hypothetical protein
MRKVVVALVAWTAVIGVIYLTKHPSPSTILSIVGDGVSTSRGIDHGEPQLVAWLVGLAVILVVAFLVSRRRARS